MNNFIECEQTHVHVVSKLEVGLVQNVGSQELQMRQINTKASKYIIFLFKVLQFDPKLQLFFFQADYSIKIYQLQMSESQIIQFGIDKPL